MTVQTCLQCGIPTQYDDGFCSDRCKASYNVHPVRKIESGVRKNVRKNVRKEPDVRKTAPLRTRNAEYQAAWRARNPQKSRDLTRQRMKHLRAAK